MSPEEWGIRIAIMKITRKRPPQGSLGKFLEGRKRPKEKTCAPRNGQGQRSKYF
jgi:hypothetical protein